MFKKVTFIFCCGLIWFFSLATTKSAEPLTAVIAAKEHFRVNTEASFDASHSHNSLPELPISYEWNFGDGSYATGVQTQHTFTEPGIFPVTLKVQTGENLAEYTLPILIFEKAVLIFSDNYPLKKIQNLIATAREENIFLKFIQPKKSLTNFLTNDNLFFTNFDANLNSLKDVDTLIFLENGSENLLDLVKFARKNPQLNLQNTDIIVISNNDLDALAKLARSIFNQLKPKQILLTRPDALREIIFTKSTSELPEILKNQGLPLRQINSSLAEFNFWLPLTFLVNYLLAQNIPPEVILLVLLLPVIAMLVAFFKQVIGITTFGVYTPAMLTLAFLMIGLKLGIAILLTVVVASVAVRHILKRYRLAYTPRVSIVLSIVALAIFLSLVLLTWFAPNHIQVGDLISASIFPMLVMSTLAEKFVSLQTEKGASSALHVFLEALLVAVVCYLVVGKWEFLRMLILTTPEIIGLVLLIEVGLGRFTGLRFTEYIRFREVIKKSQEE